MLVHSPHLPPHFVSCSLVFSAAGVFCFALLWVLLLSNLSSRKRRFSLSRNTSDRLRPSRLKDSAGQVSNDLVRPCDFDRTQFQVSCACSSSISYSRGSTLSPQYSYIINFTFDSAPPAEPFTGHSPRMCRHFDPLLHTCVRSH